MAHDWLATLARDSLGDFELTPEIDADLSLRAVRAWTDHAEREALFRLLALKVRRFCARYRRWNLGPWEFADVLQETWLVYVDILMAWRPLPGSSRPAGFGYYALRVFPLRLTDRVVAMTGSRRDRPRPVVWNAELDVRLDPSDMERDVETAAFILAVAEQLDARDARILRLRAADHRSVDAIACDAGVSRRTLHRRWRHIARVVREAS
jgi:RNA polymerase sigma factor (sigma-70 family)